MNSLLTNAVAGLTAGGAYALLGVCATFTFRLVAVVNFAGAAIGASGAFAFALLVEVGTPIWGGAIAGLLFGALVGVLVGEIMTRWFAEASTSIKAAVSTALLVGVTAVGLRVTGGQRPHEFPELLSGSAFRLLGVEVTNTAIAMLGLAMLFTLLIGLFLNRSHVGLQLRALSERPAAAELIGIPVHQLSLWVWAIGGAATTLALMLIAPQRAPNFLGLSLLVVPALASALIGFFRSFWATLLGGVVIGEMESLISGFSGLGAYRTAVPFLVIIAVLLWSQRGGRWDDAR
ncbi:branched-chain amino acid ABC transporter permease [Bradyrhizobium manausense]|uniref:branched-chain amino acid ABC transporter permease n=1 Tax=Bradyrhizobium manausense TaxID=989370 RepID=UPI001BAAE7C9|nr:branched-chain amino acid ABC transporter permease [Bradyrhizobium manausense]MBR0725572.1 branched-chain amino acid ABC transporter permease [Bradyrhizobium manausense]